MRKSAANGIGGAAEEPAAHSPAQPRALAVRADAALRRYGPVLLYLGIGGLFVVLAAQALLRRNSEWLDVYMPAARTLLRGGDLYVPLSSYLYPPFPALIAVPFSWLPDLANRAVFFLVNMGAVVALALSSWRMSGGRRLFGPETAPRGEWIAAGLGALAAGPFALNALAHQQTDVIIAALVLGGCAAVLGGARIAGAILIGLGAAFKGPPLIFAAYFILRRDWTAGLLVGAVALGVNCVPDFVTGAPAGTALLTWLTHAVLPALQPDAPLGNWGTVLIYNQSLGGTVQRLAHFGLILDPARLAAAKPLDPRWLKAIAYGALVCGVGATMWFARRRAGAPPAAVIPTRALEVSIVLMLMLLASPMSGIAHFGVLALPVLCLARAAIHGGCRVCAASVAVALACALAVNKDLAGGRIYDAVLFNGLPTFTLIALWAACVWTLARRGGAAAAREERGRP